MGRCLAGVALAAILLSPAAPLVARPYTVDDLLGHESLGRILVDPTGRWLAVEKREPFLAMAGKARLSRSDVLRAQPYLVDLANPGVARPLLPGKPTPGTILLGFSPRATHLAIARLDGDHFRLGVVTLGTGAIRWWPVAPSYDPFHTVIAWVADDRLLLIAEEGERVPLWLRADVVPAGLAAARAAATASGALAVTVAGSGRFLALDPGEPRRLLRIDVAADQLVELGSGPFVSLTAAPGGRSVAVVAQAAALQPRGGEPVAEDNPPRAEGLLLFDTEAGRHWAPNPTYSLAGAPRWVLGGEAVIVPVRIQGRRRLLIADPVDHRTMLADDVGGASESSAASGEPVFTPLAWKRRGRSLLLPGETPQAVDLPIDPVGLVGVDRSALPGGAGSLLRLRAAGGEAWLAITRGRRMTIAMALNTSMRAVAPALMLPMRHPLPDGGEGVSWLLLPPDRPAGRLPLVVLPYPGQVFTDVPPADQMVDGERFHASAQLLAAAGYAVLLPSLPMPAVLPDEGFSFARALDPALDAALATGCCDPDRIALWGHSYGGYAVAMTVAQSDRYRAAIVSAAIFDLAGTVGSFGPQARASPERGVPIASRFAWAEAGQGRMGAPPWAAPLRYALNSPAYLADRIRVPMLIIAADQDVSPVGQAEQLFSSLFRLGRDAELATYWGEGHVVGSPANLRDLYARVTRFLADTLGDAAPVGQPRGRGQR